LYTFDLIVLIEGHGMARHLFADDTQVSGACHPSINASVFSSSISDCLKDVASWMKSNRLQFKIVALPTLPYVAFTQKATYGACLEKK